ncbi:MAG TPA: HAMP domain-containing protein, partial [Thermodesulfovibrionia bacterium]|nr:HAMP domain-containing protein [Thermodesulfovibrionia bacterium]
MKIFSIVRRSLAWRLVFSIGALMVVSGVLFWYAFIRYENNELMETAVNHSTSYMNIAKKTVEFGMITVHRENIQHNVEAIASLEDVKKVRIFDDKGVVFYSSEKKEIGTTVDKKSEICKTCHSDPEVPQKTLKTHEKWFIYGHEIGNRYLKFVDPLYNEPTCYTAPCHYHPKDKRVLGLMEMDFPLERVDKSIWNRTWKTISFGIILFCILSLSLLFILWRLVSRPVSALAASMKRVAEGDLEHPVYVHSNDEIAALANNFNFMIQELKKSRDTVKRWTQTLEEEIAKKTEEIQAT